MSKLIPLSHLNEYDYKILKLAYEHEHVNLKVLKEHFPKWQSLYARVKSLCSPNTHGLDYKSLMPSYDLDYYLIASNDKLFISEIGKKVVEDWLLEQEQKKWKRREDRLYKITPIVISSIALIKSFWPEITCMWQALQMLWQAQ